MQSQHDGLIHWRDIAVALLQHVALFIALLASALISMRVISLPPTHVTVIWFPAGIALIALLGRLGWSAIPTIFIAHWAIIALANDYDFLALRPYSLIICLANTLGPALGAYFWKQKLAASPFREGGEYLKYVLWVALLPSVLTSWIVIAVIAFTGHLPDLSARDFLIRTGSITFSSALGVFLLIPLWLAPRYHVTRFRALPRWAAHALNIVLALGISILAFQAASPALILIIPLTLFSAISCGPRGVVIAITIVAIYGLLATAQGIGPWAIPGRNVYAALFSVGGFSFCLGIPCQFAAITLEQLRLQQSDLEAQVTARTQELVAAKERAESADRAKSEFLATMSHEIRTPMNGVIGFAHLLESSPMNKSQQEYVGAILSSGQVLLNLLNDILDLSKIEAGAMTIEKTALDIRKIVTDTHRLFSPDAESKKLSFTWAMDPQVPAAFQGDPKRVGQILANLVSNALKFTEQGHVAIKISAANRTSSQVTLAIEVSDTGIGINPEQLAQLFQPFRQADASTSRRFGGSGLGLIISQRLCELMNGDLTVTSQTGQGSVFTARIRLETSDSAPADDTQNVLATETDHGPSLQVLVAEDSPLNRRLIGLLLQKQGYAADFAVNGQEAVNALSKKQYDLILMDIQMPVMDGLEATRLIRAGESASGGPRIPIIAVTANAFAEDRQKCLDIGMDDHISKPINPEHLQKSIRRFVPTTSREPT